MNKEIFLSFSFHLLIIFGATLTLPFLLKKPIDLPPIISVELIQITEKTNIPFAPKAKKIIEKVKEKEKKLQGVVVQTLFQGGPCRQTCTNKPGTAAPPCLGGRAPGP